MAPLDFLKAALSLGAVTVRTASRESDDVMLSGFTPDGSENFCSNCFEMKLEPPSDLVSCLPITISTSPSVLMDSSSGR